MTKFNEYAYLIMGVTNEDNVSSID